MDKEQQGELEKEFQFYLENQENLHKEYPGKFLVIKDRQVLGVYDDPTTAFTETSAEHKPGTFIVQQAVPPEDRHVQVFHSRVIYK
jgi:hypothetical protein